MADESELEEEEGGGVGIQLDALKSYLAFVHRALRRRIPLILVVFAAGLGLTVGALRYLPRMFVCTTVMLGESNKVLEDWQPTPFAAADNLIRRKDNLETITRDIGLVKKFVERRPPLLRFKDSLIQAVFGKWDDDTLEAIVVGTLESKIGVTSDGSTLTVSVSWTDGKTAAEVAEAARESFVRTRRAADTAAFNEKMAILDKHATRIRQEVEQLAEQIRTMEEATLSEAKAKAAASASQAAASEAPAQPPRRLSLGQPASAVPDQDQIKRKEVLQDKKRRLAELEAERERQIRDERAKLADLRLKLAPSHPEVLTSQQRIAMLAQVPSDIALLRAEVSTLENELVQRDMMARQGLDVLRRPARPGTSDAAPLPASITDLLSKSDIDQALITQLSQAVTQYGSLRGQILSGRVEIDTANAAFNQRYRIVVPVEAPLRPVKPNPLMILGAGLGMALMLALLLPVLLELRTGIIVERWQVQHMQLPVLAELRLPPNAGQ